MIRVSYRDGRGRVQFSVIPPARLRRRLADLRRRGLCATAVCGREEIGWVYCGPAGWQYSLDKGALEEACGGAIRP